MPGPDPAQMPLLFAPSPDPDNGRHVYQLAGQAVEYTIRRSARRRSISLTIDEHGLRVGAPLRASQRRIETALDAHALWVVRKLAEWHARRPAPFTWTAGALVMVLGEPLALAPSPAHTCIERRDGRLQLPTATGDAAALSCMVLHWLRASANEWFTQRVAHFAPVLGVRLPSIRLSNARTRWGTCHPRGRIHLNWRLIHMPPSLVDYVVVHELAHLHEPNHSVRFWRRVEAVLPDHLQYRRLLRTDAHRYLLPL
jgi:predicted metal-dependent hydrolase